MFHNTLFKTFLQYTYTIPKDGLITFLFRVLYMNIDQKLWNKLHGTLYYKISVKCVVNGHETYTLYNIIKQKLVKLVIMLVLNSLCNILWTLCHDK